MPLPPAQLMRQCAGDYRLGPPLAVTAVSFATGLVRSCGGLERRRPDPSGIPAEIGWRFACDAPKRLIEGAEGTEAAIHRHAQNIGVIIYQARLRITEPQQVHVLVEREAGRPLENAHGVFGMDVGMRSNINGVDF